MLFAMIQLHPQLNPNDCAMTMTLHDAIMFECREDKVEHYGRIIKETMENLPVKKTFGFDPRVPIVAEVEWGQHWGEPEGVIE